MAHKIVIFYENPFNCWNLNFVLKIIYVIFVKKNF